MARDGAGSLANNSLRAVCSFRPAVKPDTLKAQLAQAYRQAVKQQAIPLNGAMGFNKAEAISGGVLLDEVDSRTMESRLLPGLFFAGELLNLDGPVGGYNFQVALVPIVKPARTPGHPFAPRSFLLTRYDLLDLPMTPKHFACPCIAIRERYNIQSEG